MKRHAYPFAALLKDDIKAAVGLVVLAIPLFVGGVPTVVFYVFLGAALLFLIYGVRTILRHMTVIEVSEGGIRDSGPFGATISWEDMRSVKLRYYSTRRDRERGWMDLRLKGRGRTLRIESAIEGFESIVRRATDAAPLHGIELSAATRANLKS